MTNDSNVKRGNAQKAMTGTDWREVLVKRPERAAECDWSKLSEAELNVLQKRQPELVAASWRSATKPCQITERH